MSTELKLDAGLRFNWALTIFFFSYMAVEIPSNLLLKIFGARFYLPSLVVGFGLVSMCTSLVSNYQGLYACRFFLGITEGGIIPGIAFYLSCFYRRHELLFRIGLFITGASLAGAFGGLLAAGLTSVPAWGTHARPMHTWRNIFFFEGIITMILGVVTMFLIPSSPDKCKFLDKRQQYIALERINRESYGNPQEKISWTHIKRGIFNINTNLCGMGMLLVNISVQSFSLFLPTILRALGWTALRTQFYSVPPYAVACCWSILVAWLSDRFKRRGYFVLINCTLSIIGYTLLIAAKSNSIKYLAVFFAASGCFPNGPAFLSWGINNNAGPTDRAVSSALIVIYSSFGAIIATWTYLTADAPSYRKGHAINLGGQILAFLVGCIGIAYCTWENRKREKGERNHILNSLKEEEKRGLGHRHPEFVYTT